MIQLVNMNAEFIDSLKEITGEELFNQALRTFRYSKEVRNETRDAEPGIDLAAQNFLYAVINREISFSDEELLREIDAAQMVYGLLVIISDADSNKKVELNTILTKLLQRLYLFSSLFTTPEARSALYTLYMVNSEQKNHDE